MSTNSNSKPHEMQLVRTHPSGAEEWHCPECKRRFLVQWVPEYRRVVLEAGDENAIHNGSQGGLRLGPTELGNGESEPMLSEELRAALDEALEDIDFDGWLDAPD